MPGWTSPDDLADEFGVTPSAVRRWLRDNVPRTTRGPWRISDDVAARAREHFKATEPARTRSAGVCEVEGCERPTTARGLCRMHYNRWHRTGRVDGMGSGAHQLAKTHCPHGHEYTPENTIVYPSDGRRRCRTCRFGEG